MREELFARARREGCDVHRWEQVVVVGQPATVVGVVKTPAGWEIELDAPHLRPADRWVTADELKRLRTPREQAATVTT